MYRIQNEDFGVRIKIDGSLGVERAQVWLGDLAKVLDKTKSPFGVIVDVREAKIFLPQTQEILKKGMEACFKAGMERAAVVLSSAVGTLQARRLARETGIDTWQRYVDASSHKDWERRALDWILNGVDP